MKSTLLVAVVLLSAGVSQGQTKKGRPADTEVIVVLPPVGSEVSRLEEDGDGRYQTDSNQGVKAILFQTDGNLSLQFNPVGKGKNATFLRNVEVDFGEPVGEPTPLPNMSTDQSDFLFAAPDQGNGISCAEKNCCVSDTECYTGFGTVTGAWDKVRLSYRFSAEVEGGDEIRNWSLNWHDVDAGRFAQMVCLENQSPSGRCLVWRITPEDDDIATLRSSGAGTDSQVSGDFKIPAEIIVCRAGVALARTSCEDYLGLP